jgi:hypothetical protein
MRIPFDDVTAWESYHGRNPAHTFVLMRFTSRLMVKLP